MSTANPDPAAINWAFVAVGAVVSAFGVLLISWHVVQDRRHRENPNLSDDDRRFYGQQYKRRLQTSALAVTLGALIALCETLPAFRKSPVFATVYVLGLLMVCLWLVLLALSDAVASRVHVSQSLRRNRKTRETLQTALAEMRRARDNMDRHEPHGHGRF